MAKKNELSMEGGRSIWKGNLTTGPMSLGVKAYPMIRTSEGKSLSRLCPHCDGDVGNKTICKECQTDIPYNELKSAYKIDKENKVEITKQEKEWLKGDFSSAIKTKGFVDMNKVDLPLLSKPYVLCPADNDNADMYSLWVKALIDKGKGFLVQFALRDNVNYGVIYPYKDRLVIQATHFGNELRDATKVPIGNTNPSKEELSLVNQIIGNMDIDFQPDILVNDREERFKELLTKKANGETIDLPKLIDMPKQSMIDQLKACANAIQN